ncbi:MAG: transposase, partial [bacterium]|nr:transposase [bacterium]
HLPLFACLLSFLWYNPSRIEVEVSPGNEADGPKAKSLIQKTTKLLSPEVAAIDSAYDSHDNYKSCIDSNIIPVIDLNRRGKKRGKEEIDLFSELEIPSSGSDLLRTGNTFSCPATHLKLMRDGKEPKRSNRQKLLCRHKDCPLANKCKPLSGYGRVFYVYPTQEIRDSILRDSGEWKKLYNFRTAIERCFSELKGRDLLEAPKVRGIANMWIHVLLSLIALIVKRIRDFILRGRLVIVSGTS